MSSPQGLEKSQDSQDPQKCFASSGAARRVLETESKDTFTQLMQSKETFGTGFTMFSSTPQKSQWLDKSEVLSSPSPAKRRASYGEIKENFVHFNEQLQTKCKATLEDLNYKATIQKNSTLNAYTQHLHKENNDLRIKLERCEFKLAMLNDEDFEDNKPTEEEKEEKKKENEGKKKENEEKKKENEEKKKENEEKKTEKEEKKKE
ncbi:merozoite surface protein 9-like [Mya arenaria]|uniref:merozoite surface protein 9-like n=1 Tax=Mya arenaria TaxID=6604 RepID=UPI0022DFB32E|nr:merozoite surface protein 9-like [Mya arenaria]